VRHGKERGAWKRKYCSQDGCSNLVVQDGVCLKHGARVKRCSQDGCKNYVKQGGVCLTHGARVKRCSQDGCGNLPRQGGVCIKHGARVKLCSQIIRSGILSEGKKTPVLLFAALYSRANYTRMNGNEIAYEQHSVD